MAEPHLDHPGEIRWHKGFGPVEMAGECDHGCAVKDSRGVAHGPDFRRYVLDECIHCGCRAWTNERCVATTPWMKPAAGPAADLDAADIARALGRIVPGG